MLDVHRGRMTWRRLRVVLQHLPPESHTMTAIRNALPPEEIARQAERAEPERGRWSQVEQLLALTADRIARVEHVLVLANSSKGARRPRAPEPIRRPGVKAGQERKPLTETAAATLWRLINGGA